MKASLLSVFAIALLHAAFAQPERAWVRIKTDYGMGEKIDTIHFQIYDGYRPRTVYATADSNGIFLTGFDISNSIDILWGYRKDISLPLIISPNDTLQITILNEKDGVLFGKRARTCANLMDLYQVHDRPRAQAYESEYTKDPREFADFMTERLNSNLTFANNFCKSTKCTKTFVTWYIKSAFVSYYRNLTDYCHAFQRRANADATQYNVFIRARNVVAKRIDLNDATLEMSSGYYDLLKSIFGLYVTPQDLRSLYYKETVAALLRKKSGVTENDKRTLSRLQLGKFSESDVAVLSRLSKKYKREIDTVVWKNIDPFVRERLADIEDEDMRKVIFVYYKGIRGWI
jgi:hypothetical protein